MQPSKGTFVRVGKDVGVVFALEQDTSVPEDHLAIWYGEVDTKTGAPKVRTVPKEYCLVVDEPPIYYH